MDDSMDASVFSDGGDDSDDFIPEPVKPKKTARTKAKSKALTQTTLKTTAKPRSKKRAKPDSDDDEPLDRNAAFDDDSMLSRTPPSGKKQKKDHFSHKGTQPLEAVENDAFELDGVDGAKPTTKSSSDNYQRLTQLEHVLKRPDTYIGSVEQDRKPMWVFNSQIDSMELREVSFVPGLYKIFDEVLVNAADNKQRDAKMDAIKVTVDRERGEISVYNNGRGIPVEIHDKEGMYIPEMIFGHLLTSSNYDDAQQKVTGGRNGFGAKLCNIFSTEFSVETVDSRQKKKYKQTWTTNMTKCGKPKITDASKADDYTKITFKPDFPKFGMTGMDDDFEALVKRRVYDLAGTCKVSVYLNGAKITKVRNFKKYMEMYTKAIKTERGEEAANDHSEIVTDNPHPRWEVGFAVSDGSFQQVSFVNSIATTSGGTHVNYISDQICNRLLEVVKKKNKNGPALKLNQIKNHIFLFINCLIVNPSFNSQTKEQLTTKASQFGSKPILSDEFLKKVAKTEVIQNILDFAQKKADQILKKSDGHGRRRVANAKLVDANKAGTKDGYRCTLILTEGESAKGLAVAGRAVVDPDLFGVFPLRGKMLNVRDASIDQISKNAEIQFIKNIIGLQHKKEYLDTKSLRYGHIMIMTDQDHDGSHIKGLLINFLQCSFPSLLKIPGFLIEFITPIVKVWKGDPKKPSKQIPFYTMPEYETWVEDHASERNWEHKYYKGLGTSTTADAEVYFRDLDRHLKTFHTMREDEIELIDLAFSKKKADARKEWLRQFRPGTYLDQSVKEITYVDFVNKELILFSMADNMRSIPSVIDGFKPGQRKVLFTCLKRNLRKDMKVVELAGLVSGLTAYQHGDVSLQQTITGMAQNFVGSNNVNCLEPSGNFGSRLQGGSDAASARYIYTRLSPFAKKIFHPADDPLLSYNVDDGKEIEPQIYLPVVPMVLINGADGIGTGWSSSIPNYNPEDIVENLLNLMGGKELKPMIPWFRGFKGSVEQIAPDRFKFTGIVDQIGDTEVRITELPVRVWTQDFKEKLEEIIKAEKVPSFIKDYRDNNSHTKVDFVVQIEQKHMELALAEGLVERFKLSKVIATSNLVAFDSEGRINRYENVEAMLKEFFALRIKFYEKRKQYMLGEMQKQLEKLSNQARFIKMIIDGDLVINRKKKVDLVAELHKKGFKPIPKVVENLKEGELAPIPNEEDENEEVENEKVGADHYDYLLGMALWTLTKEKIDKLMSQIHDKEAEIDALIKLSKEDLWKHDLEEFITEWRVELEEEANARKKSAKAGRRASMKLMIGGKNPGGKKRKGALGDDSDSDFVVSRSKKNASKQTTKSKSGILDYLHVPAPAEKATSSSSTVVKKEEEPDVMEIDKTIPKADKKPVKRGNTLKKANSIKEEDSEGFSMPTKKTKTARQPRAAARKPIKYELSSDSGDNGDDSFGDISNMVKGISGGNSKPTKSSLIKREKTNFGISDDDDEDFAELFAPKPRRPAKEPVKTTGISKSLFPDSDFDNDDEEVKEEDEESVATTSKASKSLSKPIAKAKSKLRVLPKKSRIVPLKKAPLSPVSNTRGTKAAKGKAKATSRKKTVVTSEDEDEVDALANDILDSDDDEQDHKSEDENMEDVPVAKHPRRAAARKPKYVVDDDDDDEEEDADSFVVDDDDDDDAFDDE